MVVFRQAFYAVLAVAIVVALMPVAAVAAKKIPETETASTGFSGKVRAYLEQKGSIRMCVDPDWMPYESIDHSGKHVGMSADYLQALQQASGLSFELVPTTSWNQSLGLARSRRCDIISLAASTPGRRSYLDFTSPYLQFSLVIATRSEEIFIEKMGWSRDMP